MLFYSDVRQLNRKTFKLHEYRNYYYDLEQLVEDLYLTEHKWSVNKLIFIPFYLFCSFGSYFWGVQACSTDIVLLWKPDGRLMKKKFIHF